MASSRTRQLTKMEALSLWSTAFPHASDTASTRSSATSCSMRLKVACSRTKSRIVASEAGWARNVRTTATSAVIWVGPPDKLWPGNFPPGRVGKLGHLVGFFEPVRRSPRGGYAALAGAGRLFLVSLLVLQLPPQNLAHHGLGKLVAEFDPLRYAIAGQTGLGIASPLHDLLGRGFLPLTQHDERLHGFPGRVVRDADHGHLLDLRMAVQDLLDIRGIHVEPGHDDHVLLAIDDLEIALAVHLGDVPAMQPPNAVLVLSDHLVGLFFLVPVAQHHLGAGDRELPGLAGGDLPGGVLDVHELAVGVGNGKP